MLIQIHKNPKLIENIWSGKVKIGSGQSGLGSLKLTVSEE